MTIQTTKIVLLSTFERTGGAAVAANRLMKALSKGGHEVHMLVRDKQTDDEHVATINSSWARKKISFIRFAWERFVIFAHNRFSKKNLFSVSIALPLAYPATVKINDNADLYYYAHFIYQPLLLKIKIFLTKYL